MTDQTAPVLSEEERAEIREHFDLDANTKPPADTTPDETPQDEDVSGRRGIHGKAVTCTECGTVVPIDLPENAAVPEFFMPSFDRAFRDFVHPDGTRCGFHEKATP